MGKDLKNPALMKAVSEVIFEDRPDEFKDLGRHMVDLAEEEMDRGKFFAEKRQGMAAQFARAHLYNLIFSYALNASVFHHQMTEKIKESELPPDYLQRYRVFLKNPVVAQEVRRQSGGWWTPETSPFHLELFSAMLDFYGRMKGAQEVKAEKVALRDFIRHVIREEALSDLVRGRLTWLLSPLTFLPGPVADLDKVLSGRSTSYFSIKPRE